MLDLPYSSLKDMCVQKAGKGVHFYQYKWTPLPSVPSVSNYKCVLDTVQNKVYTHPMVTTDGATRQSTYFVSGTQQYSFADVESAIQGRVYVHTNTIDGAYLLVTATDCMGDTHALCAAAYRTLTSDCIAVASRPVNDSDRQVHWVWFRKPNYKLTTEIVLRSKSWIVLNPGYTFHLWTSLLDKEELDDFLSELTDEIRLAFLQSVTVHYKDEFHTTIFDWLREHTPDLVEVFQSVWDSVERQDTVMKTDYTRNILLAVFGGIYTDFNDLLCLSPIEPVLAAHAGRCVGVTDNTSLNNASNYFMYAAKGCPVWLDITKRCTHTLPFVRGLIYSEQAWTVAKDTIVGMTAGIPPNMETIQNLFDSDLGKGHSYVPKMFLQSIDLAIRTAFRDTPLASSIQQNGKHATGRAKESIYISNMISVFQSNASSILASIATQSFAQVWRFARTDMYLRTIMHNTNLPIFCREQSIPLFLVPFGYLIRYNCLLSFVGHLGDATSYGMEGPQRTYLHTLFGQCESV